MPLTNPDLGSRSFKANPFEFYAQARAEAPVVKVRLPDKRTAWLVMRYDEVVSLLRDSRFIKEKAKVRGETKQPWMPAFARPLERNMLDIDEPDHRRLRVLVQQAFTPKYVELLRNRIEQICMECTDRMAAKGDVDLIADYALPIAATVIAEMLGVPPTDRTRFHRWSSAIVAADSSTWDMVKSVPSIFSFLHYIRREIEKRRGDSTNDFMTELVRAEESGERLSDDELVAMVFLLLVAGHETSVNLVGNGVLALLQWPAEMDKLRRDASLTPAAVEEMLRFEGPILMSTERYALEDLAFGGMSLRRGDLVYGVLASADRDERQFPLPDMFDVSRTPNRHVAFGYGLHHCLGAPLARLEAQIAVGHLLGRFPTIRLRGDRRDLRWRRGLTIRGVEHLPLAISP